jgi:hypothetical protein
VRAPDKDDWIKVVHSMKYLRGTRTLSLILSATNGSGILPLQGALFRKFRDQIMGVIPARDPGPGKTKPRSGELDTHKVKAKPRSGELYTQKVKPRKGKDIRKSLVPRI